MIKKVEQALITLEGFIAAFSLFMMLALSLLQIITRNFFNFGYAEIEIINRYLLVICGTMGAVIATSKLKHIKIDALTSVIEERSRRKLQRPIAIFSSIICLLLSYYASIFVFDEWEYAPPNERWALPFTLIYPAGFILLSIHFLFNCIHEPE
jgi:TRAP-type C4-dicarboxylate transport system permease small subunit